MGLYGGLRAQDIHQRKQLKRGQHILFLPQGVEHGYTIRSDEPVRLLVVAFPTRTAAHPGWGGFITDVEAQGELVANPTQSGKHGASTLGT